jgi:hypothetical protein
MSFPTIDTRGHIMTKTPEVGYMARHAYLMATTPFRMAGIPETELENLVQNLDMSFPTIDTRGHIMPKTPEVGYMARHAYLMATRPP